MKILTKLTATVTEGQYTEPRGILQAIYYEAAPGFFVQVCLGAGGIVIKRKEGSVAIPIEELIKLGQASEPAIAIPANYQAPGKNLVKPADAVFKLLPEAQQKAILAAREAAKSAPPIHPLAEPQKTK